MLERDQKRPSATGRSRAFFQRAARAPMIAPTEAAKPHAGSAVMVRPTSGPATKSQSGHRRWRPGRTQR